MPRIIAADDNQFFLKTYEMILDYLGIEFELCENGEEAVAKFKEKPADLVILDVNMPVMDGLEACRQIRQMPSGIGVPIVIVSSLDQEDDIINGLNAGANDYMLKPVKEAHLIAKIRTFLKTSSLHKFDFDMVKNQVEFAGHYRIRKLIGYGAHSVVFLAEDIQADNKKVAIKLLKKDFQAEQITQAFFETADQLMKIDSDYNLKIYEYGQFDGRLYLILEYADGGDIAHLMRSRKITEREAVNMALDVSRALLDLEPHELIHLDIKPENIMLQGDVFKLGDFGLVTTRETVTMPVNLEIWTTAAYLPPEYLTDAEICPKSDVYSLGVTLYHAVTGDNPFVTDKPAVSMYRQVNLMPTSIHECDGSFTNYFSDTVQAMMSKDIDSRPTAGELVEIFSKLKEYWALQPEEVKPEKEEDEEKNTFTPISELDQKEVSRQMKQVSESLRQLIPTVRKSVTPEEYLPKVEKGSYWSQLKNLPREQTLKVAIIALVAIAVSLGVGNIMSLLVFDAKTPKAPPGALMEVVCRKCNFRQERRIKDISKSRCSKCGARALSNVMMCRECKRSFPFIPPDMRKAKSVNDYLDKLKKASTCPFCKSTKTYFAPTAKEKKSKLYVSDKL